MTSCIRHRPPAFDGKGGYQPRYQGISAIEKSHLMACLSEEFTHVERMESVYEFPSGFYRIGKQADKWDIFFKILPSSFQKVESFAASVEAFLLHSGVFAREVICQPFSLHNQDYFYCKMPFMTFSSMQGSSEEAIKLGQYLKSVHKSLTELPEKEEVKANWIRHKQDYESALHIALSHGVDSERYPFVLKAHLKTLQDSKGLLNFDYEQAQVVHGDLNPGNILFDIELYDSTSVACMIIDYEISHSSYFPREFDVAMLIQRLYLEQYSLTSAIELMRSFLKGYGPIRYDLISAMKAMPLRSLLILLSRMVQNQPVGQMEWLKFVNLYRFIDENKKEIRSGIELK